MLRYSLSIANGNVRVESYAIPASPIISPDCLQTEPYCNPLFRRKNPPLLFQYALDPQNDPAIKVASWLHFRLRRRLRIHRPSSYAPYHSPFCRYHETKAVFEALKQGFVVESYVEGGHSG